MRVTWLVIVGIAALSCKDKDATRVAAPDEPAKAPRAGSATPDQPTPTAGTAARAPSPPSLFDVEGFEREQEDQAWAASTEQAIVAAAPDLTNVECRHHQCRATLTASNEAELVAKSEKVQREDALPTTEATQVLWTAPETVGGKLSMTVYVRYDR